MITETEHAEIKITWPVICFGQGTMLAFSNIDEWGDSNVLGVTSGWYDKLKFIDSVGNVFVVKEIVTSPNITCFDRWFSFVVNRRIKVKTVQYEFVEHISLEDFKALICKEIDIQEEEREAWSSRGDPDELKDEILKCLSFEEIMRLLK